MAALVTTMGAVLVSGCLHVQPDARRSMTSTAEITRVVTVTRAAAPPVSVAASFDLDHPEVERNVAAFQNRLRGFFDQALWRGARYLPTMTDILEREGLPRELAYVPLIESGYRTHAVSRAGAVGPWQFIPETGRRYGLRIDSLVDERRDPVLSTEAAVAYLRDLHAMFGDWELSLAAYNSGENRVARLVARPDVRDFWDMRKRGYLPTETSQYVPKFLAAVRIASAPERYGFTVPVERPMATELVDVDRQVTLATAARLCGVATAELAELNPALRRGITPSSYVLRVPAGKAEPLRHGLALAHAPARPSRTVARGVARSGRQVARTPRIERTARRGGTPRVTVASKRGR